MSLARDLAKILRDQFQMHVAWMPVTTRFSLGDYGQWRDGVFVSLGNIAEFGVTPRVETGRAISFNFSSVRASTTHIVAGARVPTMPAGDVEAETRISFGQAGSFLINAGKLTSTRISNIAEVARRLDDTGRWRWQYKIVGELFMGEDVLLVATTERDTNVSLRGRANALAGLQGGGVGGRLQVSADKRLGLEIVGGAGPVGLGLFRVRISGAPVVDFYDEQAAPNLFVDRQGRVAEVLPESDWSESPPDDELAE